MIGRWHKLAMRRCTLRPWQHTSMKHTLMYNLNVVSLLGIRSKTYNLDDKPPSYDSSLMRGSDEDDDIHEEIDELLRVFQEQRASREPQRYAKSTTEMYDVVDDDLRVPISGETIATNKRWNRTRKQHSYGEALVTILERNVRRDASIQRGKKKLAIIDSKFKITRIVLGAKEAHITVLYTVNPPKEIKSKFSHAPIRDQIQKRLETIVGKCRFELGDAVQSRYVPELVFQYDVKEEIDINSGKKEDLYEPPLKNLSFIKDPLHKRRVRKKKYWEGKQRDYLAKKKAGWR